MSDRNWHQLQLAVIGAGGRQAAEFMSDCGRRRIIVAAVDTDRAARRRAEGMGLQTFGGTQELLQSPITIDAAYLAVPHEYHAGLAKQLLNYGITVLKEKPLAVDRHEAQDLLRLAMRKGTPLFTTAHRPYRLVARQLKASLHLLGEIYSYTYEYSLSVPDRTSGWRSKWTSARGGVMLDMAYHQLDFIVWLLGEQTVEGCQIAYCYGESKAERLEDSSTILTRSANGASVGRIITNRHAHRKTELLTLYGTQAVGVITPTTLHLFDRYGNLKWEVREPQGGPWANRAMYQKYLSNRNNSEYWLSHMRRHAHVVDCLTTAYEITSDRTPAKEQAYVQI